MSKNVLPATLRDLPDLAEIFYSGFNSGRMLELFPPTPQGREFIERMYEKCIRSEPGSQEFRVFVARDQTGKVVASASYYLIGGTDGGLWPWRRRWPEPGDGVPGDKLDAFLGKNAAQHEATIKDEAHIYLAMFCTLESHRKQGYGTALLEAGNRMADELDQACYLDASDAARRLSESGGYVVNPHTEQAAPWAMLRPKISERE